MRTLNDVSRIASPEQTWLEISLLSMLEMRRPMPHPGLTIQMLVMPEHGEPWGIRLRIDAGCCRLGWRLIDVQARTPGVAPLNAASGRADSHSIRCLRGDFPFDEAMTATIREHLLSLDVPALQILPVEPGTGSLIRIDYADERRTHAFRMRGIDLSRQTRHLDAICFLLALGHSTFDNPLMRSRIAAACARAPDPRAMHGIPSSRIPCQTHRGQP